MLAAAANLLVGGPLLLLQCRVEEIAASVSSCKLLPMLLSLLLKSQLIWRDSCCGVSATAAAADAAAAVLVPDAVGGAAAAGRATEPLQSRTLLAVATAVPAAVAAAARQ